MELKKLEYLESIYRLQSFSKAAEEHYISQPSISNAIQKLEQELGVTLIDRASKPLVFTPEGVHFMAHVYNILNAVKLALLDMQDLVSSQQQVLKLAIHSTLGDWVPTSIYSDFCERYPKYHVKLLEIPQEEIYAQLLSEVIELAYALIPEDCDLELFETIPVQNCELYVMLPKNHPLENRERIFLSDLKSEKLYTPLPNSKIYARMEQEFKQANLSPRFYPIAQIRIIQDLVEQGKGISFLTVDGFGSFHNNDKFSIRPFQEPINFIKGFLFKKGHHPSTIARALMTYIQNVVQNAQLGENR